MMLTLYKPAFYDLWFREQMLSDPETMAYNHAWGGTISFPQEKWQAWADRWLSADESVRCYRYLMADGRFVGEIAYHIGEARIPTKHTAMSGLPNALSFLTETICLADVLVYAPERGKGCGRQGLALLCDLAVRKGITELYDNIAADNPAVKLFLQNGFTLLPQPPCAPGQAPTVLVMKKLG